MLELIDEEDKTGKSPKRKNTKAWIKRIDEQGYSNNMVRELSVEGTNGFKEMTRMNYEDFPYILELIEKCITPKQILGWQKVINAKSRLILTIRFLATGESYRSLRLL